MSRTYKHILKWKMANIDKLPLEMVYFNRTFYGFEIREIKPSVAKKYGCEKWFHTWFKSEPRWWRKLYHTRPRRRNNTYIMRLISTGKILDKLDGIVYSLDKKPHNYYY